MITSDETTNPVEHHLVVKRSISFFTVASYSTVQLTASIAQFTMQFYSVTIFITVSSLFDDKHLFFLFYWRSVLFLLVRGVFLSTKIARNTPNSMKENLLLFLLHHATKRSGGDVWLMWGRGAMFRGQWVGLAKGSGTINHCWQTQLPFKTLNYRGADIWALGTKLGRSHLQDR